MTAAQKTAKDKFKKAIAYRQKTGVSLKEAFAHIYGKKVGSVKKKPVKKAAKRVYVVILGQKVIKGSAKHKNLEYTKKHHTDLLKHEVGAIKKSAKKKVARKIVKKAAKKKIVRKVVKKAAKKKVARKTAKKVTSLHTDKRSHNVNIHVMSGVGKIDHSLIKKYKETQEDILKQNQYLSNWQYAFKQQNTKANKMICRARINEIKKYISELKQHSRELKKLLK